MRKLGWTSSLSALFLFLSPSPAVAISIGFAPTALTAQVGSAFNVDVVISGLFPANEVVSAYDLSVAYDATFLSATSVNFGAYLSDPFFQSLQDTFLGTPGVVNFAELSFLSDSELAVQQPDTFTLATLSFDAVAVGSSTLSFMPSPNFGIDVKGTGANVLPLDAGFGVITVTAPISIPEPSTVALMLISFLAFRLTTRTRSKRGESV